MAESILHNSTEFTVICKELIQPGSKIPDIENSTYIISNVEENHKRKWYFFSLRTKNKSFLRKAKLFALHMRKSTFCLKQQYVPQVRVYTIKVCGNTSRLI